MQLGTPLAGPVGALWVLRPRLPASMGQSEVNDMGQATTDLVMIHEEKEHLLRTKVGHG